MNTQLAFAFGMLTMVAISMLVVIVVGMVKVMRLAKEVDNLQRELENTITNTHRRIDEEAQILDRKIDVVHRRFDEVHSIVDRRFDDTHGRIDNEVRSLVEEVHNTQRHIDSRFDKFENRIKSMPAKPIQSVEPDMTAIDVVIEKTKSKKQLLKD